MITNRSKSRVVRLYTVDQLSMHEIAAQYKISGNSIRRALLKWGVVPRSKSEAAANRPAFTAEHRQKLSKSRSALFAGGYRPHNKGIKASVELRVKNMLGRMGSKLDLSAYGDYEKLKVLTYYLSKHRKDIGTGDVSKKAFLEKFYNDSQFSKLYDRWKSGDRNKWERPTLDHKKPKSRGGQTTLSNLQFLTWFENRAKAEMTEDEWSAFKSRTNTKSACFVRR